MAATSATRHLCGGCVTFNTAGFTDGIVTRDGPISGCWPGTSLTRSRSFRWQDKRERALSCDLHDGRTLHLVWRSLAMPASAL